MHGRHRRHTVEKLDSAIASAREVRLEDILVLLAEGRLSKLTVRLGRLDEEAAESELSVEAPLTKAMTLRVSMEEEEGRRGWWLP